jgi:hypothetical protein
VREHTVMRSLLVVVSCLVAGLTVILLGAATLPEPSIPSDRVHDTLAKGTLEPGEAAEWNRAIRFPSRLLVWGVLPAAALVMGGLARTIERRRGGYLAPLSFTIIWIAIVWGQLARQERHGVRGTVRWRYSPGRRSEFTFCAPSQRNRSELSSARWC